jgi:hypothetical protein
MISIESPDGQRALDDLRAARKRLSTSVRAATLRAADPIADGIRKEAAWSSRIPDAVRVVPTDRGGARVIVDPQIAPEAAPLNNGGQGGTFTHPVFGNEWEVEQPAHPFLQAGAARGRAEADRRFDATMAQWERSAGFQ